MEATMKRIAHTPGPWHVSHLHRHVEIESHQDGVVATLDARSQRVTAADIEANARLIAAAPDLLAALKALVSAVERDDTPSAEGHFSGSVEMEAARHAIQKAEGEAAPVPEAQK